MTIQPEEFLSILEARKKRNFDAQGRYIPFDITKLRDSSMRMDKALSQHLTVRKDVVITEIKLNGIPVYLAKPSQKVKRVILHFHGGGYVCDFTTMHHLYRAYISELAHTTYSKVYSIDYRVAPEHPYPAALDDAYQAYLALLAQGIKAKDIFLNGDSAGGGLMLALLMKIRDNGNLLPAAGLPISPWTDLACTGESRKSRVNLDPIVVPESEMAIASWACGDKSKIDPLISPLYGSFKGLPPLMIVVGGREILYDDSIRIAEKAKKEGVDVTMEISEEMVHVYPLFVGIFPESKVAILRMAQFMNMNHPE